MIRRGVVADAAAVADVYVESRHSAEPAIPRLRHTPDEVRDWFASIVLPEHEVWVAALADRLVGIAVLRGECLDQLYVRPAHQGHGVGSRLLDHAKRQRRVLRLTAFQDNHAARAFYEKRGFRAIAFGDGTTNEEQTPDVVYEWRGIIR